MLQSLRKHASGLIAKLLMALLIVSFGIWGIADVFRGFGSQTLATIGSTEITVPEFRQQYQERLQQISQQIKRGVAPDQARALGIPDQLLSERLGEAALDDRATRLKLALSDDELAKRIQENPAFFGPSGAFDHDYFQRLLRSNGFTEARFVAAERKLALRQQLIQSLGGGIELPAVLTDGIRRFENEERSVDYVILQPTPAKDIADPTEEVLRSFFDARKVAFKAPEFRKISVLALTPDTVAKSIEISDADVQQEYNANIARFGTPEKRVVQQIVFPNAEEAKAAADKIAAGTSFGDVVVERKLTPADVDLGNVSRDQIVDKAVADAAFALPQDGTSGVINGRFGPVIVHVGAIAPGSVRPLADVAAEIRTELQVQRARQELLTKHDQIEDDRAGGSKLTEIASKYGLAVQTLDVDRQGKTADGTAAADIPGRSDVLSGAFASDVGAENDPVQVPGSGNQPGGYVWYDVEAITPSRDRTFEEARAQVLERWKQDEAQKALEARIADMKKRIEAGESFAKVAQEAGLELKWANGVRRGRASAGIPQGAIAAVFDTKKGGIGSTPIEDGDSQLLFQVRDVTLPAGGTQSAQILDDVRQRMEQDLMTEYLVRLQSDLGVRINRVALDQIVGGGEQAN
ncbi:MAG: peptidylprolyl isomerase [Microvirga sp.]|jgi:peptidyl-prolyl cis-trans isomerase D|nr:peptidylprolyl isomerase [Microvirga sp.]